MSSLPRDLLRELADRSLSQQLAERADWIAVESVLRLTPEERLRSLARAAAFFSRARRV